MNLFVVRHGQTYYNIENKVCGPSDMGLNEKGIKQAEDAGKKLCGQNIDKIYSSPLKRALKTAEIIAFSLNFDKKNIITDYRLSEQNYGIYEGVNASSEAFQKLRVNFAGRMPKGESPLQAAARAYDFLNSIWGKNNTENVLLVTHGSLCRAINSYFYDMNNSEYFSFMPDNCEVLEYKV